MAFDAYGRYTANHKSWDHVGNIIPDIEHSEGERPHFEFRPASWLPVQFYDKHYENWNVVMPGKPVALDPDGNVMPAEYGLTSGTPSVVYTADDVTAGTIDIATGLPVTTAKTVVLANLTGVRHASWTAANAGTGTGGSARSSGFMGRFGESFYLAATPHRRYPVGIAPYAYLQWAGGDGFNPALYTQHNYNMQHQVAVLCDYVIKLPVVPAQKASETVDKSATGSALVIGTANVHTRAYAQANVDGRYNATTGAVPILDAYPVIAVALDEINVATQTSRTLISLASDNTADDVSDILVNEVSSVSAVTKAGDYWIDYEVGVIFIYSANGADLPTSLSGAAGTVSITYYYTGAAPSVLSKFACILTGDILPGDFLKTGTSSNYVKAAPGTDHNTDIIGQVLGFVTYPKDGLDRVRTAYNPAINTNSTGAMANATLSSGSANLGQMDQMPGSANGGFSDLIHFAGAADTLAIVNLIGR